MRFIESVPPGATVLRTYYAVPSFGTVGPEFETGTAAIEFAQKVGAKVVDRRVWFSPPTGVGSIDISVERIPVPKRAEALTP